MRTRNSRYVKSLNGSMRDRQGGLTLIELMIALVLGLLVVSALFNVFLGSSRSAAFSDGLRAMQENGRHGISTLQRGLRRAGYHPDGPISPFDMANGSATKLIVSFAATTDCNGLSTATEDGIATNTYELDAANNRITCTGGTATATTVPLIEGVEAFSVLYGVDSSDDGYADQYAAFDAGLDPFAIKSVRIALLVNSIEPIRTRSVNETHAVLDIEVPTNDRIARNVFTTTVLLRNRR